MAVLVEYRCIDCGFIPDDSYTKMICPSCGGRIRGDGPGITGTRDNFGIKKVFNDDETGKEIDNWKSWEKAGYRNPVEVTRNHQLKEKIKQNIKKRRNT